MRVGSQGVKSVISNGRKMEGCWVTVTTIHCRQMLALCTEKEFDSNVSDRNVNESESRDRNLVTFRVNV